MKKTTLTGIALASFALLWAAPLSAQFRPQFGRAVAIDGGQVLIVKTGTGRGPAAVYVYAAGQNGWEESGRLGLDVTGTTGHGLSPSIWAGGGQVFVGSGDPGDSLYALAYTRDESGEWRSQPPVAPGDESEDTADQGSLDLQGLMRILRPPQRVVAGGGDFVLVATLGQAAGRVEAFRLDHETGAWSILGSLEPESGDTGGGFGASVAVAKDHVFVGAPRQDAGVVYVFATSPAGWQEVARVEGAEMGDVRRFGAALAIGSTSLLVGAPGTGSDTGHVITLSLDQGEWVETGRLTSASNHERDRFGTTIAKAGSNLLVGAPGADERAGSVEMFEWTDSGWTASGLLPTVDLVAGDQFGSALAGSDGLAVAGAPGVDGGIGQAIVYLRNSDGSWSAQTLELPGALSTVTDGEVRCVEGDAAGFSCDGVDLLAFLTIDALGGEIGERVSDLWGWTDPATGREYALIGRTAGLAIVEITNPSGPRTVGIVPANPSMVRDIKVYSDHVFFTGDGAQDHGLVVFDLTRLRDVTDMPTTFEPDARYEGIHSAHNLAIDTESGFAYAIGASGGGETCGGGLHMIDIRSPTEPTFAGCYTDTEGLIYAGRSHDTQCVVYRGPDADYEGRQLCFASNETALRIVDVTDKQNPVPIAVASYPAQAYIHQGWLTEDHRFFYLDDELDEIIGNSDRTRTLIWDLTDLDDPTYAGELLGADASTDHNLYIKGDRMYQANYAAGLRVVDVSDPTEPVEVGHFDTTPYGVNPPGFSGAWTAFPFFESGTVIVSSMNEGLFILRPERPLVP